MSAGAPRSSLVRPVTVRLGLALPALACCALLGVVFDAGLPTRPPAAGAVTAPASLTRAAPLEERLASVGEVVSLPTFPSVERLDAPRSPGPSGSPRRSSDGAARFDAQVVLVARRFCSAALRLDDGRTADRPSVSTCPAQGPPPRG